MIYTSLDRFCSRAHFLSFSDIRAVWRVTGYFSEILIMLPVFEMKWKGHHQFFISGWLLPCDNSVPNCRNFLQEVGNLVFTSNQASMDLTKSNLQSNTSFGNYDINLN